MSLWKLKFHKLIDILIICYAQLTADTFLHNRNSFVLKYHSLTTAVIKNLQVTCGWYCSVQNVFAYCNHRVKCIAKLFLSK